ncbi:MAG: Mur ligase family protein [Vicinamibacterales bacterium]
MTPTARLFALEQFGIKLGLDAMRALLAALGHPHHRWPSLHIAGTNGKGSVSAMTERALRAAGLRTGRYTSPHLYRLEERVAIDGVDVDPARFEAALTTVFAAVDRLLADGTLPHSPTFFEVSTAAAFVVFAEAAVDVAVVEVGLGGRYDATNVVTPVAGAIVSIDFDHERHLGSTLAAIAHEKAGIAKAGVPLVVGDVPAEAWDAIARDGHDAGALVIRAADEVHVDAPLVDGHARLSLRTPAGDYGPMRLALAGTHQAGNAVVAVRLLETFATRSGRAIPRAAVETGLADARWPARLEWLVRGDARVLVDAAHNPAGARGLASYLAMAAVPPVTLVTSVMADKDVANVLAPLLPHAAAVIATQADTPRAARAEALAGEIRRLATSGVAVSAEPDARAAVDQALHQARPVLLAGSIYLVGPLRARLVDQGFRTA